MKPNKTQKRLDELTGLRHRIGELEASAAHLNSLKEALSIVYDAIDCAVAGMIITDLSGRITYVNPAFLSMFEYKDKEEVLGKDAAGLFASKEVKSLSDVRAFIDLTQGATEEFVALHKDGTRFYVEVSCSNVTNDKGNVSGRMASFVDITQRKHMELEQETLIAQLQSALAKVKTLRGLVPICASCKNIRDDKGFWHQVEAYIHDHSEAVFSHSICPDCALKLYPELCEQEENNQTT
ncbi:MAG: PAS domain-containing protein [Thermodesulfobacteriota bacterium]|nr:PAS domain-containing protein [Thermodesulfobacteriota bacterium]